MKELTIEEKARAYDKAIEVAQKLYQDCPNGKNDRLYHTTDLEKIFPQLCESEDEKIRKELIEFVKSRGGFKQEYIAWLEKQEGCEHIKKEWLEHIKQSWYKEGFIDGKYSGGTCKEWTINDAATLKELIDFLENGTAKLQHDLTRYANWLKIQFTPIEKQCNPTDEEMKELLRTEYEKGRADAFAEMEKEQSENDEKWSEKDENMLLRIKSFIQSPSLDLDKELQIMILDWLDNRYRFIHWKPSKEHLYWLHWLSTNILVNGVVEKKAAEILEDLYKNLRQV